MRNNEQSRSAYYHRNMNLPEDSFNWEYLMTEINRHNQNSVAFVAFLSSFRIWICAQKQFLFMETWAILFEINNDDEPSMMAIIYRIKRHYRWIHKIYSFASCNLKAKINCNFGSRGLIFDALNRSSCHLNAFLYASLNLLHCIHIACMHSTVAFLYGN